MEELRSFIAAISQRNSFANQRYLAGSLLQKIDNEIKIGNSLEETLNRWLKNGRTDDMETQLDDYGKRVVREVLRALNL